MRDIGEVEGKRRNRYDEQVMASEVTMDMEEEKEVLRADSFKHDRMRRRERGGTATKGGGRKKKKKTQTNR